MNVLLAKDIYLMIQFLLLYQIWKDQSLGMFLKTNYSLLKMSIEYILEMRPIKGLLFYQSELHQFYYPQDLGLLKLGYQNNFHKN